jgi:hypothetical protein
MLHLKRYMNVIMCISAIFLLSGCMYPQERLQENQVPNQMYLEMTQKAIDQFRADESLLPLVTKTVDTNIFEKYEIDFTRLVPKYLPDVPANAFEKGGIFKYVLIDVETKPIVKLIHLGIVSKVSDVQQAVYRFKEARGMLPVGKVLENGYFAINYNQLSMKDQSVESVYQNQLLPLVMNKNGEVGIDYSSDLAIFMRNSKKPLPTNIDPRYELARNSVFVPFKSFPYSIENGEPHLMKIN